MLGLILKSFQELNEFHTMLKQLDLFHFFFFSDLVKRTDASNPDKPKLELAIEKLKDIMK